MTPMRDPDRLIDAFLAEGPSELPGRTYEAVRADVDHIRQRAVIGPWRQPRMSSIARIALVAVAVLVVAVIAVNLVPASNIGPGASPSPSATPRSTATDTPVGNGPIESGGHFIDVRLHGYEQGLAVMFAAPHRVSFLTPQGWDGLGWAITKYASAPPAGVSFAPWTIDRVFLDPCHWRVPGDFADAPMMRQANGLAEALSDWWGAPGATFVRAAAAPTATKPVRVTLAGLDAWYVEVTAPSDIDFADCDGGQYRLWLDAVGGERYLQGPGEVDRLWIVDVDGPAPGGLLVIDTSSFPGTSAEDRAELEAIVDSIQIEPITGAPGPSDGPTPVPTD